jgi:hypothetical protein
MTPPSKNVVRLVRRPVLEDNESLRGYMLRLDAENCLKMFSNELTTLSAATKAIGDVAYATNCRESALRNRLTITYSNALRVPEADIFGVTVPLRWINRIAKKICPMCLLEVGHMSIFWEIRLIKTCFIHSAFLITVNAVPF